MGLIPPALVRRLQSRKAGALAFVVVLVASAAGVLAHLRQDAIDGQQRELGLLSTALADEMDRGLQGAEVGLRALREELQSGRLDPDEADAQQALRTRAELMPLVRSLWVMDEGWRPLAASDETPMPPRDAFAVLPGQAQAGADPVLAFSRPVKDAQAPAGIVVLAERFAHRRGAAGGWILAAIPSELLLGAFTVASPAADARMAVFRADGVRLAGDDPHADGSERLLGRQSLPHHAVTLVLSRELDAVLEPWRTTAQFTAMGVLLLGLVVLAATGMVGRANRRRAEAQAALEAQLARASKLESLGTLAGGVAHDFNNILGAILGFGEMVQDAAPEGSAQARQMGKVMQAALRGKALVERILAFSRGGAHASVVFELAPVIEEVLGMLAGSLRAGIVLECALDAPGARVRGDPTQAFEAVMNLCTNAMQAMPQHGTLGVSLVRERVAEPKILSHSRIQPGRYLALSVSDDGVGITPQVMDRLFEPFFTTRSDGSGTGLGLAVVHGVVTEFGGAIDVASQPGQGTRFTIYLPECEDSVAASTPPLAALPMGRGQRILVVDDQPALVELVQEMLAALGYRPATFTDPVAALAAFQADPAGFAAVITDEVMPAMTGTALTAELRRASPDVPVLLVSGYGGVALATRATAAGVDQVLSKPLQRADLATALARLLA